MKQQRNHLTWHFYLCGLLLVLVSAAVFYTAANSQLHALGFAPAPASTVRFAVIGDFGTDSTEEGEVATLVKSWTPELITTVGDNNYPDGAASTIDVNIGQYYHEYIFPYTGTYGPGATQNRFFPALGNHDWHTITCVNTTCSGAYFDYFTLPGNERYYDFVQGPVHFFMIDSDSGEPDGTTANSVQAAWLQAKLAASTAPWKLVFMHHAPYSSSTQHGSNVRMQWPYADWGAHAVLAGHDHTYERVLQNGIPYFVNGAGGAGLYQCGSGIPGSQICYDSDHGAMLVEANDTQITFQFTTRGGQLIDSYTLDKNNLPTPTVTPTATITPPPGIEARISQSTNDAEEVITSGAILLDSTDLEFMDDPARGLQVIGLRFPRLAIPQGTTITNAYIEFTVDEANSEATSLTLRGHAVDHARVFTTTAFDISQRPQTAISVTWANVPVWDTVGAKQRTPNLAPIVQEIVNRPGWVSGNALAFVITGSGHRTAEAYEKASGGAPLLRVEFAGAPTPTATPTFVATASMTPTKTQTPTPTATVTGQGSKNGAWLPYVRR